MSRTSTHTIEADQPSGLTIRELHEFSVELADADPDAVVKARVGMRGQIKSLTVEVAGPAVVNPAAAVDVTEQVTPA